MRKIEAQYKQAAREAEEATHSDPDHRRRHEYDRDKATKKMTKVMAKVRAMFEKRERMRAKLESR